MLTGPFDSQIRVTEISPMDQPIERRSQTTAAFIGRALRGPLNTAVSIRGMADFSRRFGGVWSRSSLGPAVEQFFAHGGRQLYVVRVANYARGAMICLPAHHGVLVLRALEPGSTEQIRAAVDYDGIDTADTERFNLIVQRVSPINGHVIDQEIYRRVSADPEHNTYIGDALLSSALVTLQLPLPAGRPAATMGRHVGHGAAYVGHAQRGSDGSDLCDYDLIGSAAKGTGLFALDAIDRLDLLYLPPLARGQDAGPAALVAAERYCRRRGGMLLVDPPSTWTDARSAVAGMRQTGYRSPNMLSYFPRMTLRGSDDPSPRGVGGAIAGLLSKLDALEGPWGDLAQRAFAFNRTLSPALGVDGSDIAQLNRAGLNAIAADDSGRAMIRGAVTLGRGSESDRQFALLPARRLSLAITNTVERATRWAIFEADGTRLSEHVYSQVDAYMQSLAEAGAFADANYRVQCDAGPTLPPAAPARSITVLLMFRPRGCNEPVSLTLHQTISGCRVASTAFAPAACA